MTTAAEHLLDLLSRPALLREVYQALDVQARERWRRNGMRVPDDLLELTELVGALLRPIPATPKCNQSGVALREGDVAMPLQRAAAVIGCSRQNVARLVGEGRIRGLQLPNRRWLVSQEDVMAYIDERAA